jgi:hypothetical protein
MPTPNYMIDLLQVIFTKFEDYILICLTKLIFKVNYLVSANVYDYGKNVAHLIDGTCI